MSLESELNIMRRVFSNLLLGQEKERSTDTPYLALLEQAFGDLSLELYSNGYSKRLEELREEYTRRLLIYWKGIATILGEQDIQKTLEGETFTVLIRGDEKVSFFQLPRGAISEDREDFLLEVGTLTEEHSFYVELNKRTGNFHSPISLESEIKIVDRKSTTYKIEFEEGKISKFERTIICDSPDGNFEGVNTSSLEFSA